MNRVILNHVTKRINNNVILDDVTYTFEKKGFYCLLGDSGCGKTTLLDIISGVDEEYVGDCLINGISLNKLNEEEKSFFRLSKLGYLRQNPDLIELDTCEDNMLLRLKPILSIKRAQNDKVKAILKDFKLEKKAKQTVNTLSGGERSRLSLASIILADSDIILADEPTAGLDKENAQFIFKTLKSLSSEKLIIVVTHDSKLANEYADKILRIQNKTISEKLVETTKSCNFIHPKDSKRKYNGVFSEWIRHSFRVLNKKKLRTIISVSLMSFSLFSLGLSLYLKRDLNGRLNSCLSSLVGENTIVMKKRNSNETCLGRVVAASVDSITSIKKDYPSLILDNGITYLANFEDYFPQENNAYVIIHGNEHLVPSLSVRTFSDFLWLDSNPELTVYPEKPYVMERSQIILGLPFDQMSNVCFKIGISRTYSDLGNYLSHKPLEIILKMQNDSWSYVDEQIFSVVGVAQTSVPSVIHLDHSFNEYVLEEKMRFPSSDEHDTSLPWILQKVFYIEPSIPKGDFIKEIRTNELYRDFIFEPSSYSYERTHEKENIPTPFNRLYVYQADKRSLGFDMPENVFSSGGFNSYSLFGEYTYAIFPDSLAGGFYNPFFMSDKLEVVESTSDAASRIKLEQAYSTIDVPDDVVQGSYLLPRTRGLTFSSDFRQLVSGREPQGVEEICISKTIAEKFNNPTSMYVSGAVSWNQDGDYLQRDYVSAELKVVGVVDSDCPVIYGISTWNIDFWRDVLGMSSFLLEPTTAVFYTYGNDESLLKSISARYQNCSFTCPSLSVESSLVIVTSYLSIVLAFASALTLLIGVILFITVSMLTSIEQSKEGRTLFYIGFKKSDIHDMYVTHSTVLILSSLFSSLFGILVSQTLVDKAIQNSFGVSLPFFFDFMPIAAAFAFGILTLLVVSVILKRWVYGRDYRAEKR